MPLVDTDASVLEPVIRDVAEALAPYLDGRVLSFPIENHLAAAVRAITCGGQLTFPARLTQAQHAHHRRGPALPAVGNWAHAPCLSSA